MPGHSSSSIRMSSTSNADFEFQEMKVHLNAMRRDKVPSRDLPVDKRQELEQYVSQVVTSRPSPVPLERIGDVLPGTKWRLGFSSEAATLGDLPRDADVYLEFVDDAKMNYVLQFSKKTLGLNRLTAKSSYTVDVSAVVTKSLILCEARHTHSHNVSYPVESDQSRIGNLCL